MAFSYERATPVVTPGMVGSGVYRRSPESVVQIKAIEKDGLPDEKHEGRAALWGFPTPFLCPPVSEVPLYCSVPGQGGFL